MHGVCVITFVIKKKKLTYVYQVLKFIIDIIKIVVHKNLKKKVG